MNLQDLSLCWAEVALARCRGVAKAGALLGGAGNLIYASIFKRQAGEQAGSSGVKTPLLHPPSLKLRACKFKCVSKLSMETVGFSI